MHGFTDLRPDQSNQANEESFWPSFSDLMMVVLMIFLITTSALYMRNWQLVQEMSAMVEAERQARQTAEESVVDHAAKQQQLDDANAELLAASEVRNELQMNLEQAMESLRKTNLLQDTLRHQNSEQTEKLSAANSDKEQLLAQLNAEKQKGEAANAELTANKELLMAAKNAQIESGKAMESMKIDFDATTDRMVQLRKDYAILNDKYTKLLKPARSAKGRHVVMLRHGKVNGELFYEVKNQGDAGFRNVGFAGMNRELDALLKEHGDRLFLRLVYPKESGLSYNEAYEFSNEVLKEYDYYYRVKPITEDLGRN